MFIYRILLKLLFPGNDVQNNRNITNVWYIETKQFKILFNFSFWDKLFRMFNNE